MENSELFEELASPIAQQRSPIGSHHYVADEDVELFSEETAAEETAQ